MPLTMNRDEQPSASPNTDDANGKAIDPDGRPTTPPAAASGAVPPVSPPRPGPGVGKRKYQRSPRKIAARRSAHEKTKKPSKRKEADLSTGPRRKSKYSKGDSLISFTGKLMLEWRADEIADSQL